MSKNYAITDPLVLDHLTGPVRRGSGVARYEPYPDCGAPVPDTHVTPSIWATDQVQTPGVKIGNSAGGSVFIPLHSIPSLIEHLASLQVDLERLTGMDPDESRDWVRTQLRQAPRRPGEAKVADR